MSCGVSHRCTLDPALLWHTTVPIQPLAWEPPYATGAAQEIATTTATTTKKDKKTKKKKNEGGS